MSLHARTQLIALSGYAQPQDVQRTLAAGFGGGYPPLGTALPAPAPMSVLRSSSVK